jgi:charged multivesicular body protein 3
MVGDAMGSALDAEDMEEETEAEVQKVLNELAVDAVKIMPAAGRARAPAVTAPAVEAPEEEEAEGEAISGLQARLDAIRAL